MSKIGLRECHIYRIDHQNLLRLITRIRSELMELDLTPQYSINVYGSFGGCCGVYPASLMIEIKGPKKEELIALDLRTTSKLLQIFEKSAINYHMFEPLEIV